MMLLTDHDIIIFREDTTSAEASSKLSHRFGVLDDLTCHATAHAAGITTEITALRQHIY
jgi:hypothetical protein